MSEPSLRHEELLKFENKVPFYNYLIVRSIITIAFM